MQPSQPSIKPLTVPSVQLAPMDPIGNAPDAPEWFSRLQQRIPNPSARNTNMSTDFNTADLIERHMQEDGHQKWGFVVYRTTYDSEDDWTEFLRRLRFQVDDMLDIYGGRDLLASWELTVMADRARFAGASTDVIRRDFQEWSLTAYAREQQNTDAVGGGRSARYRFAVQVDAGALRSVVHDASAPPTPDTTTKGWVKLIDKSWYLGRGGSSSGQALEPVEGLTQRDVGWMKVSYQDVMTECYTQCRSINYWSISYCRPLKVAGARQ